tara:strand:- start:321 stop:602 length:282 start_codon:yes stop_codon:yes gene_type:complete
MVNKNILKIRKQLDRLDDDLLGLIKKRIKLVSLILKNKKFKNEIVDNKRISVILRNIKKKSRKKKIDVMVTEKIWKSMIRSFIDYEYRNFDKR